MDFLQFFNPEYWLGGISDAQKVPYNPISIQNPLFWWVINVSLFFIILGFTLIIWNQFLKPAYQKKFIALISSNAVGVGMFLLFWFIGRTTNLNFVGSRLFLLGIILYFIGITAYIVRYYLQFYRIEEAYALRMSKRE
jgi:predicted membrane channel-forming protein YqfA (hemolysin III family)